MAECPFSEEYDYRTLIVNDDPSVLVPVNLQATARENPDYPGWYNISLTWECSAPDVDYEIYWVYQGNWLRMDTWSAPPGSIGRAGSRKQLSSSGPVIWGPLTWGHWRSFLRKEAF